MPEISPTTWDTLRTARARAAEWNQIAKLAMDEIKEQVGHAEEATIGGRPVVRHSTREVTRVDTKTLRAEIPEPVLAPYLRTTVEHRYDLIDLEE